MKSPLTKIKTALVAETALARQKLADERLKLEKVRASVHAAANLAWDTFRMEMPAGSDLRGTPAAKALEHWAQTEGLALSWEKREAVLTDGRRAFTFEPEISWRLKS